MGHLAEAKLIHIPTGRCEPPWHPHQDPFTAKQLSQSPVSLMAPCKGTRLFGKLLPGMGPVLAFIGQMLDLSTRPSHVKSHRTVDRLA